MHRARSLAGAALLKWEAFLKEARTLNLRFRLQAIRGRRQRARFALLAPEFHGRARPGNGNWDFITPMWGEYTQQLQDTLFPEPSFRFQQNQFIAGSMVFEPEPSITRTQLTLLEEKFDPDQLRIWLLEDPVGHPPLFRSSRYLTSPNTIHHLYHLARFFQSTHQDLAGLMKIVEWGGGYGNLAKLFRRMGFKGTYVIIDLPFLSALQWLYLSTIFGESEVSLVNEAGYESDSPFVLLPLPVARESPPKADLFVSTWALSESSSAAQDWVADINSWFGARNLLLAFQESTDRLPDAGRIRLKAEKAGAKVEPIELQPGNFYAFL